MDEIAHSFDPQIASLLWFCERDGNTIWIAGYMITVFRILSGTGRKLNGTGRLLALAFMVGVLSFASAQWLVAVSYAQGTNSTAAKKPLKSNSQSKSVAINKAIRLLKKGQTNKATALLNKAITAGGMSNANMARALHYRGVALRKQGKPAQAIADLTSALWLKNGLTRALRQQAEANRAAAYKEAGYARATGRAVAARSPGSTRATSRKPAANTGKDRRRIIPAGRTEPTGWQARTTANAPVATPRSNSGSKSGNAIGNFFSNLFSGGAASKGAQPTGSVQDGAQISAWNSTTSVGGAAATRTRAATKRQNSRQKKRTGRNNVKRRSVSKTARTARTNANLRKQVRRRAPKAAVAPSRYRLILSPVRSEAKARANARAMQQKFARLLAQRQPVIETTSFGGSTFYQVRVGPFNGANSPRNICAQLKAGGVDCILNKL